MEVAGSSETAVHFYQDGMELPYFPAYKTLFFPKNVT
jgi:hypothetical protein